MTVYCLLSTFSSRSARALCAYPSPSELRAFSALVADGMYGMFVVISREMWRVRGEKSADVREKALIARFFRNHYTQSTLRPFSG